MRFGRAIRPLPPMNRLVGPTLVALLSFVSMPHAMGIELPPPEQLEAQSRSALQTLTVIEPHESTQGRKVVIEYRGFSMPALLDRWFGPRWRAPDTELQFHARDGYRSVVPGPKLARYRAILAISRADGRDFAVGNLAQHQTRVPLGPYYLVWDNQTSAELQDSGSLSWPYQVDRIELRSTADDRALVPANASAEIESGFQATKSHCLTCHQLRGVGGTKSTTALERALCDWREHELERFIDNPSRSRPGIAMPALAGDADPAVRQRLITRIVAYLRAVKSADACMGNNEPR